MILEMELHTFCRILFSGGDRTGTEDILYTQPVLLPDHTHGPSLEDSRQSSNPDHAHGPSLEDSRQSSTLATPTDHR